MEPSKAITARLLPVYPLYLSLTNYENSNLFAIDYLKDHPDTTKAEFKKVVGALDGPTKQVSGIAKK